MRDQQSIIARLAQVRAVLRRRRSALAAVQAVGLLALILAAAEMAERSFGLREPVAAAVAAGMLAVAVLWGVAAFVRAVLFQPTDLQLAARIEEAHPELMDSLHCAVEKEPVPETSRRILEDALVKEVRRTTSDLPFTRIAVSPRLQWRRVLLLGAVAVSLLAVISQGRFTTKARYGAATAAGRTAAGLRVEPGDAQVPVHADLTVQASVHRWERDALIEYTDNTGSLYRFPMNRRNGREQFTFYSLTGPVRYRVLTPALASAWYTVQTYSPPKIKHIEMEITPPAYTAQPPHVLTELDNISVIAGSRLTATLTVAPDVRAALLLNNERHAGDRVDDTTRVITLNPQTPGSFAIRLTNADGRDMLTPEFELEIVNDLPPVIDVVQPGQDTTAKHDEAVGIAAQAADDFGVAAVTLHYSVSGGPRQQRQLYNAAMDAEPRTPAVDVMATAVLDVAAAGAEYGDVISYFLTATDNRVPSPQTVRSEVYFIEIRPDIEPREAPGGEQPETLPVHKLIAELKRLIRLAYDIGTAHSEDREALLMSLVTGLADTRTEAGRQLGTIEEQIPPGIPVESVPLLVTFKQGVDAVRTAENLARRGLADESIPYQEMALSRFVAVAQELAENMQGGGEGDGESDPSDSQEQEQHADAGPQDAQPSLEEQRRSLQELLRDIHRLADRQGAVNSHLQRVRDHALGDDERADLSRRLESIRQDTDRLQDPLPETHPLGQPKDELRSAAGDMRNAQQALGADRQRNARGSGMRAHQRLLSAAGQVRELLDGLAAAQVQQLAREAARLEEMQRNAASASRSLADGATEDMPTVDELRSRQGAVKERTEELLDRIAAAAADMRGEYAEVSEALSLAVSEAEGSNLTGEMIRAENALLYEAFGRAAQFQSGAADILDHLSGRLDNAADALPRISQEQLLAALQQLNAASMQLQAARGGDPGEAGTTLERTADRMASMLGNVGEALRDDRFREIEAQLRETGRAEDAHAGIGRAQQLLDVAARLIHSHVYRAELERRIGLARKLANPPEQYRSLVEEYFRELSESE